MLKTKLKTGRVMGHYYPASFWSDIARASNGLAFGAESAFKMVRRHIEVFGERSRNSIGRDMEVLTDLTDDELAEFLGAEIFEVKIQNKKLLAKLRKIDEKHKTKKGV